MAEIRCPVKSCRFWQENDHCSKSSVYFSQDYGAEESEDMSCDDYEPKERELCLATS